MQETHPLKIGMVLKNGREKEWVKQPHDLEAKGLQKLQKNIENVHSFRTQAEFKLVMGPGIQCGPYVRNHPTTYVCSNLIFNHSSL